MRINAILLFVEYTERDIFLLTGTGHDVYRLH